MALKKHQKLPIEYWSHSSLVAYLRNPLSWYKRYVLKIYDTPTSPSAVVGRAGHLALQHFYSGADKEIAIRLGLEYVRSFPDFELNFGTAASIRAKKVKRANMEKEYCQAINYYLARPPKHTVLGVEVSAVSAVPGFRLPLKAISDLVVASRVDPRAVDVIDHKFVDSFSKSGRAKPLFVVQALFNYFTVRELFGRPVRRFIVYECKKRRNADGHAQMRRYELDYEKSNAEFALFKRLVNDATDDLTGRTHFLPNPSDIFDGEDSFIAYRLNLLDMNDLPLL